MTDAHTQGNKESNFGIVQLLVVSTLLVAGLLVVIPIHRAGIAAQVAGVGTAWVGMALWPAELAVYALAATLGARRSLKTALGGAGLGLGLRLIESAVLAAALGAADGTGFGRAFAATETTLWPYHLLAIVVATLALLFPLRELLRDELRFRSEATARASVPRGKQFSFASRVAAPPSELASLRREEEDQTLRPPAGMAMPGPAEGVVGMLHIPVTVVTQCIPELAEALGEGVSVRARLADVAPQLRNATVWLQWKQLVVGVGSDGGAATEPALGERWVRVAARDYVALVPRELFESTPVAPTWMKATPMPQEDQFPAGAPPEEGADG